MKKLLLGALLLLSIVSCSSPEEKLINDAEKKLIENLKDPSSYERIEAKITDTITSKKWAEDLVKSDSEYFEEEVKSLSTIYGDSSYRSDPLLKQMKSSLDISLIRLDSVKKSKDPNKIREIVIEFKYRAKNSMGALDIQRTGVEYIPDLTIFKNAETFNLYEIK